MKRRPKLSPIARHLHDIERRCGYLQTRDLTGKNPVVLVSQQAGRIKTAVRRIRRELRWIAFGLGLVIASTAQAKIGETRDQLIKRFGHNQIHSQDAHHIAFRGDNGVSIMLRSERSVAEAYMLKGQPNVKDVNEIIEIVVGSLPEFDKVATGLWMSTGGAYSLVFFQGLHGDDDWVNFDWGIIVGITGDIKKLLDQPEMVDI